MLPDAVTSTFGWAVVPVESYTVPEMVPPIIMVKSMPLTSGVPSVSVTSVLDDQLVASCQYSITKLLGPPIHEKVLL